LQRKMIDTRASARGDENIAAPREAMRLMELLYRGEAVNRALSDDVLTLLKLRKASPIPKLLPSNVVIANKPGNIEGASCDWGLVLVPNRPYAIVVMTNYIGEGADEAIAKVSKLAYDYFARLARSSKYGARVPVDLIKKKP
jgi:beta-lactamase class A